MERCGAALCFLLMVFSWCAYGMIQQQHLVQLCTPTCAGALPAGERFVLEPLCALIFVGGVISLPVTLVTTLLYHVSYVVM